MRLAAVAWTPSLYLGFRMTLGVYLACLFATLIPYGAEIFSNEGVLPDSTSSPFIRLFPNVFAWADEPAFVGCVLAAGVALGVSLAVGIADRTSAVALWYLVACLFGRNPLILNPAIPWLGWLLLAHACIPRLGSAWRMPAAIHTAAWIVMAASYSYSGVAKLASPSWLDGSALTVLLDNPLARMGLLRALLLELPSALRAFMTWGVLTLELAFAPLSAVSSLRAVAWWTMTAVHVILLILMDFGTLTAGMLMVHFFTMDPRWIGYQPSGQRDPDVAARPGESLLRAFQSIRRLS